MKEKTDRAKASASIRWKDAIALQPHSNRNANGMRNDAIKVKESKEKKVNGPAGKAKGGTAASISFKKEVFPIIKLNCLPCHTEDQMNPSELYLETYDDLMKGGKHGVPVIAGKADSSLIIKKLTMPPPFGDPMPLRRKTSLSPDTIAVFKRWINQGAKNN